MDPLVEKMIQYNPNARFTTIGEIKKELIGRRVEFVALQELNAKRREVLPASSVPRFEPIQLVSLDWRENNLVFRLNENPDIRWINRFQHPREQYTSIVGAGPGSFNFQGDTVAVPVPEHVAQQIVDYFKRYLEMANRGYQKDLTSQAEQIEREQREKLAREIEEADTRARILKNVKV